MENVRPISGSAIDLARDLNEEQLAAVTAPAGPALVLAGAGSGKTRTLTYRVSWLCQQGTHPLEILLLTFTNKAAREMVRRVEALTRGDFPTQWSGTFHSVGGRFLRRHAEKVGLGPDFTILDEGEAESLLGQVMKDTKPAFVKEKENPKKGVVLNMISYARNTLQTLPGIVAERFPYHPAVVEDILHFAQQYERMKLERNVVDFDDLLGFWRRILDEHDSIAARYQNQFAHILVDEYQDTNRLQSAIIDRIAIRHQLMAVGDDAQCIYTWRGADFENIATFEKRHPGTRIYKIETNYRSTPPILQLANGILRQPSGPIHYHKELRPVRTGTQLPQVAACYDARQETDLVIARVSGLIEEGYAPGDIAVLYRAHYQALELQLELTRRGVPFVITSGVKFFEQAHIRDLAAHLRFLCNPRDASAFVRICSLLPRVGEKTAIRLHDTVRRLTADGTARAVQVLLHREVLAKVPSTSRPAWTQLANSLVEADSRISPPSVLRSGGGRAEGNADLFSSVPPRESGPVPGGGRARGEMEATGLPDSRGADWSTGGEVVRLLVAGWYGEYLRTAYPNWESRMDDLNSLSEFADRFQDLSEFLAQLILLNGETNQRAVEHNESCLRLTTIHQAKGLEFPVVFVIACSDGLFPLRRSIESGDLDEERRLFYVAVTRAQNLLHLTYPTTQSSPYGDFLKLAPSRFLTDIPSHCYEHIRLRPKYR